MTTFTDVAPTRAVMTEDQMRLLAYVEAHPSPRPEPERDSYGRYKLLHPESGKVTSWTRATTLAGSIEDTYNVAKWANRLTAIGVATHPHLAEQLVNLADPTGDDKRAAQRIADEAKALAGGDLSSSIGTALHTLTEHADLGDPVTAYGAGEPWAADLRAYLAATEAADLTIPADWVERIVIVPELRTAGTLDRIVTLPDGRNVIFDLKTGSSIDLGMGKIAAQLAVYAHATHMWAGEQGYELMPAVDQAVALVAHMPAGSGTCTLYEVNIERGWELAKLCATVRDARNWGKKLGKVYEPVAEVVERRHAADGAVVGHVVTFDTSGFPKVETSSSTGGVTVTGPRPVTEADIVSRVGRMKTENPDGIVALRALWDASGIAKQPPWDFSEVQILHRMILDVEMPVEGMVATPAPESVAPEAPTEAPLAVLPSPVDGQDEVDGAKARDALNALRDGHPDAFATVKVWAVDSRATSQPWQATVRGEALTLAAIHIALVMFRSPAAHQGLARVRAILAYVTQDDLYLDARHPVGALVGSLTVDQANEARTVAETWAKDKATRDLISGIASEAATGEHTNTTKQEAQS